MERDSRSEWQGKASLEELMRERIRGTIELIVEQELEAAIGAASSQRIGDKRAGYRHGHRGRTLSTSLGASTIAMPRARIEGENGRRHEWRISEYTQPPRPRVLNSSSSALASFQVGGVETLSEPVIYLQERRARFVAEA
jgi:hypothetical protein